MLYIYDMYKVYIDGVLRTPQNIGSVSFSYGKEEDNGARFFRKNLSDSLIFKGADYEYFDGITNICQTINISIEQSCGGPFEVVYEGTTTRVKCDFNEDRCVVAVDFDVNDEYKCILDNISKEFNWLAETNIVTVDVNEMQLVEIGIEVPDPGNWQQLNDYTITAGTFPEDFEVFARKVVATACVGGVPQAPAPDGTGLPYVLLSNNCAQGFATWRRDLTISELTIVNNGLYAIECTTSPGPLLCDPLNPPAQPNATYLGFFSKVFSGGHFYIPNLSFTYITIPNGRYLTNVIDFGLQKIGCNSLTLQSEFFTNATNPVLGTDSTTKDLILFDKGDVARPDASEKASKNLIRFRELLGDLYKKFNVRWFIDSVANKLVIEHISDIVQVLGLDLTLPPYDTFIKNKNKYDYQKPEIPLEEKWKYPIDAVSVDFAGFPIEYEPNCKSTDEISFQTEKIETELDRIFDNPDDGTIGIVLVSPETINKTGDNSSLGENGRVSGIFQPNAPMGYAATIEDFQQDDRPLPEGTINNVLKVFNSSMKIRQQMEIKVPYVGNINTFDPNKLVRTFLGDAEVESAEYNLRTKYLTLQLVHA